MPGLTIPKEQRSGLNKIRTLQPNTIEALLSELERSPGEVPSLPDLSASDAEVVIEALRSLYHVRAYFDVDTEQFASDVTEGLQELEQITQDEAKIFKDQLRRLLGIESLVLETKAESLQQEYEHRYCTARVLSDIRPVFSASPSEPPRAASITHTLRLSYHEVAELKEIYIAMDAEDLADLKDILRRAEAKAKSLRIILDKAKIREIGA